MIEPPYALTCELTHRCPLKCLYCSNPLSLIRAEDELTTDEWLRVICEAKELGIVQVNFSGGEPLAYEGLPQIVALCKNFDLYTHLVTSGIGLDRRKFDTLRQSGLESIQISFQADDERLSESIAGGNFLAQKRAAASLVAGSDIPLTLNVVLSRFNLDRLEQILDQFLKFRPRRIELANVQFYGWALANRSYLLPSSEQLKRAEALYLARKAKLNGEVEIDWVISDYFENYPKPCMGGWASTHLCVTPVGEALPCLAASAIKGLPFPSVKSKDLSWIWYESEAFNRFRGLGWMTKPCSECELRFVDFGGCRCQAFLLTGDASSADPVCRLSPARHLIDEALAEKNRTAVRYRCFSQPDASVP
ncbi:MAG TPA: pyrroloquinoline quinone biosynthesis protein PqqE [Candidatus Obscuribacterales bacterium]